MALEILATAIERSGLTPRRQVRLAIDVASTHFWHDGQYVLQSERRSLNSGQMAELLEQWTTRYPIVSIEDPLAEDDWEGWQAVTRRLGSRVQLIGDDLFATNLLRLEHGI